MVGRYDPRSQHLDLIEVTAPFEVGSPGRQGLAMDGPAGRAGLRRAGVASLPSPLSRWQFREYPPDIRGSRREHLGRSLRRRARLLPFGPCPAIHASRRPAPSKGQMSGGSTGLQEIAVLGEDAYDFIAGLCVDPTGRLWVATSHGRLGYIEQDRFVPLKERVPRVPRECRTIMQDSEGVLWVGTADGSPALRYKDRAHRLHACDLGGLEGVSTVNAVCEHEGLLWVETAGGLFSVDLQSRKVRRFTTDQGYRRGVFWRRPMRCPFPRTRLRLGLTARASDSGSTGGRCSTAIVWWATVRRESGVSSRPPAGRRITTCRSANIVSRCGPATRKGWCQK